MLSMPRSGSGSPLQGITCRHSAIRQAPVVGPFLQPAARNPTARSIPPSGRSRSPHRASLSSPGDLRDVCARAAGGKRDGECVETRHPPPVMTQRKQDSLIRVRPHRVKLKNVPTESVFPLVSRNYKVSATVGVNTVAATTVRAIVDTGAGPNLIREEVLPEDWERYRVSNAPVFNVVAAGGRRLRQKGVVTLVVQLVNLRTHARFLVVTSLAAECILGCHYIDLCTYHTPEGETSCPV
jgi:Retroviral aspartyl protease